MPWLSKKLNRERLLKSRLQSLREAGLFLGFSVLAIMLVLFVLGFIAYAFQAQAATGINQQINYQGKLTDENGVAVADGTYNVKFAIYDASSGETCLWTAVGSCADSNIATTTITTVNGIFSAVLGGTGHNSLATSTIATTYNWNIDNLYLGVTVRGTATSPVYDSEMTPRKRLTASPYAFNADLIDGINATSTAAVANYLLSLDSYGNLNLFNQGVSSTYATTTWLYVRSDAQIDGNATTTGSFSASEYYIGGNLSFKVSTDTWDIFLGLGAGLGYESRNGTFIGYGAGENSNGDNLTFVGFSAGINNNAPGVSALGSGAAENNTGEFVTAVGSFAAVDNSGDFITVLGNEAANGNSGNRLLALGAYAGATNTADFITAVGYYALKGNSGANAIALGANAGYSDSGGSDSTSNSYSNVIAIGYNTKPTANNQLVIGDHAGTGYITDGYFGSGVTSTAPYAFTLHASGGWTGNTNGADLRLVGGIKAGSGSDGDVILAHDGTNQLGFVGVATTTPGSWYGEKLAVAGGTHIYGSATTSDRIYVGAQLSVATTSPWAGYELAVAGDTVVSGNFYNLGNATTTGQFEAGSVLYAKDSMVGVGIDPSTLLALGISSVFSTYKVWTGISGIQYSNYFYSAFSPTADSSATNIANYINVSADGSYPQDWVQGESLNVTYQGTGDNLAVLAGLGVTAELANSSNVTTTYAIFTAINNGLDGTDGGGDMTNAYNFKGNISLGSLAGTVSNFYNVYASTPSIGGGAIINNYAIYVDDQSGATQNYAIWTNDGQVRLDNSAATTTLYVTGDSYFAGNATTTGTISVLLDTGGATANVTYDAVGSVNLLKKTSSLRKYKSDIDYNGVSPDLVYNLQPISYTFMGTGIHYYGLIAEDVALVDSRFGTWENGEVVNVEWNGIIAALIATAKAQKVEIEELEDQIEILQQTSLDNTSVPLTVIDNPDLNIQTLAVHQAATFYGTLYVYGEAGFMHKVVFEDDIEVKGKIYASADQAGTATILAGATSTEVMFGSEYKVIPKITSQPQTNPNTFSWISDKSTAGFRINIANPQNFDITFDWITLAVKLGGDSSKPNLPPSIDDFTTSLDSVGINIPVELWAKVTDPDTEEKDLTYTWELNPNLGIIEGDSGLVYWTVPEAGGLSGETQVTIKVTVTDGFNTVSDSRVVTLIVPTQEIPTVVLGCLDQAALNYNASATQDDGSCQYPEPVVQMPTTTEPVITLGCTDQTALNYNSLATQDDGSCTYPKPVVQTPTSTEPVVLEGENGVGGPE